MQSFDVCIVGAGAAGVCAAHGVSALGLRVALIDPSFECRPSFKAEKLEPDQLDLLQSLGLFEHVRTACTSIRGVDVYRGGRRIHKSDVRQYGMRYEDFVNALIASLPASVSRLRGHLARIGGTVGARSLQLRDGSCIDTALVVLATGTGSLLGAQAGLVRKMLRENHTVAFGFDMDCRQDGLRDGGINVQPKEGNLHLGYLTLFPIAQSVRGNLFAYCDPRGEWSQRMRAAPAQCLQEAFPGLQSVIGPWKVSGKVTGAAISLWTTATPVESDVIAIGDAYQSVCPSTGTGLSKVLTDVSALLRALEPAISGTALDCQQAAHAYYSDARKQAVDSDSLVVAANLRSLATTGGVIGFARRRGLTPWHLRNAVKQLVTRWATRFGTVAG